MNTRGGGGGGGGGGAGGGGGSGSDDDDDNNHNHDNEIAPQLSPTSAKYEKLCLAGHYNRDISVTLVLLGLTDVGKTTFLMRCMGINGETRAPYEPTDGIRSYQMYFSPKGGRITLVFVDTPGHCDCYNSEMTIIGQEVLLQANGIIFVYDTTRWCTFSALVDKFIPRAREAAPSPEDPTQLSVPCVIMGNKLDLTTIREGEMLEREVSYAAGEELAAKLGCRFHEVSALGGEGVDKAFVEFLTTVLDYVAHSPRRKKKKHHRCKLQ